MEVTCAVLDETTEAYARTNIECLTEEDRQYEGTTDRRYSKQSVCGGSFTGTLPGGGGSGGGEDPLGGGYDDGQEQVCFTCGMQGGAGAGSGGYERDNGGPCNSNDPPAYCSKAGSCFNKAIGDAQDRKVMKALEEHGAFDQLWKDSMSGSKQEQAGFLVPNGYDSGYTFQRVLPKFITRSKSGRMKFKTEPNLPKGTLFVHTHPFGNNDEMPGGQGDGYYSKYYKNGVGPKDRPMLRVVDGVSRGIILDKDQLLFFGEQKSDDVTSYDRCGY